MKYWPWCSPAYTINWSNASQDADPGLLQLQSKFPDEGAVKLKRFLVARKNDVSEAIKMVETDRKLRNDLGALEPVAALPFLKAGLFYFAGFAM